MEEATSGRIFRYLLYAGVAGTAGATTVIHVTSTKLFLYPAATITLALFLASLLLTYEVSFSLPTIEVDRRVVDISLLLAITILASFTGPREEFPSEYFLLILVASLLLAYRITSVNDYANLLYIVALGIVIRANIWFSAPHFSKDPRIHVGITGFIKETGRMVPFRVDDYHDYPIADIYSGMTAIVTDQNPKHALFLSLGFAGMIAVIFVYLFVRRLFEREENRMGSYAAFLFSMSAFAIGLAAGPKPQTLAATLFTVAIFGTQLRSKKTRTVLVVFIGIVMVFTHVLAPLVLATTLLFYYAVSVTVGKIQARYRYRNQSSRHTTAFSLGVVTLVMILQRYHEAGNFRIQLSRIFGIFLPSEGNVQRFVSRARPTTTSEILLHLDDLLLQAGDFLLGGLLVGVAGVTFLYYRVFHAKKEVVPDQWVVTSFLMYAGFSLVFFTQATQARRAAVALLAVTAPVAVYPFYWFRRRWQTVGRLVIVSAVVSGAFFGIANPGVYKIERTSGFVPALYTPDLSAIEHVETYSTPDRSAPIGYADGYTASGGYFEAVEKGYDQSRYQYLSTRLDGLRALQTNQTDVADKLNNPGDPVYIYRTYYEEYTGLKPPPDSDVIYSSGETQVLS